MKSLEQICKLSVHLNANLATECVKRVARSTCVICSTISNRILPLGPAPTAVTQRPTGGDRLFFLLFEDDEFPVVGTALLVLLDAVAL